jgi:hypothetical protein
MLTYDKGHFGGHWEGMLRTGYQMGRAIGTDNEFVVRFTGELGFKTGLENAGYVEVE